MYLIPGVTAVFGSNLSNKCPPLLCGEMNEAQPASQKSSAYHKGLKNKSFNFFPKGCPCTLYTMKRI